MERNLGSVDRLARFVIAFVLLTVTFLFPMSAGWKALLIIAAIYEAVTASFAY
jgi:hypothetical protein